ncbi:MAG: hypothetical protein M3454_13245 [Actinomycetota bacterium]|nr:hypothetical protein [Actinomycetota bacterium]
MTTKPPATALREALQPGDPVSVEEAATLLGTDAATASASLTHLASRGDVTKVRKALWVRAGAPADPYRLGARIVVPYAFSYGTALALHGAAMSERSEVLITSPRRFDSFEHDGVKYRRTRPWAEQGRKKVPAGPEFVWVTTPERTLVECIRIPSNAGGFVDLYRAATALPRLDPSELLRWVDHYAEANLAARLGFLLETTERREEEVAILPELERRIPTTRIYLERGQRGGRIVSRWNLIVPSHLLSGDTQAP